MRELFRVTIHKLFLIRNNLCIVYFLYSKICTFIYACIHAYTHTRIHTYAHAHARTRAHTHTRTHTHTNTPTHTHTAYLFTHTHTHKYTYRAIMTEYMMRLRKHTHSRAHLHIHRTTIIFTFTGRQSFSLLVCLLKKEPYFCTQSRTTLVFIGSFRGPHFCVCVCMWVRVRVYVCMYVFVCLCERDRVSLSLSLSLSVLPWLRSVRCRWLATLAVMLMACWKQISASLRCPWSIYMYMCSQCERAHM